MTLLPLPPVISFRSMLMTSTALQTNAILAFALAKSIPTK